MPVWYSSLNSRIVSSGRASTSSQVIAWNIGRSVASAPGWNVASMFIQPRPKKNTPAHASRKAAATTYAMGEKK